MARTLKKVDPSHPLIKEVMSLPSCCIYNLPTCRANRSESSFLPGAITLTQGDFRVGIIYHCSSDVCVDIADCINTVYIVHSGNNKNIGIFLRETERNPERGQNREKFRKRNVERN